MVFEWLKPKAPFLFPFFWLHRPAGYSYSAQMNNPGRLKAVGQFGGQGAVASVSAAEVQDANCCIA